ncbi:MAG: AraC family transcriptional regulator [Faecalimonas sp.]|nr:AraC family transcriptional regulator [Faecalimonas sp.]
MPQKGIKLLTAINVNYLVSAFHYHFRSDFSYDGEAHAGWEFVYVEQGHIKIQADDATYVLRSGEMVCHKPMEFHKLEPYEGDASCIIFCFECADDCMQYFNNKILFINQRQKVYLNDIASYAKHLFAPKEPLDISKDGAMDRASTAEIRHEQFLKNSIELLVLSLLSSENLEKQKRAESFEQTEQRLTLTAEIIAYLEAHLQEPIRLATLAELFPYSISSMKRIFKLETGSSIIDYLNRLRIKKAIDLLENTSLQINDIAIQTGFSDVYYFSNAFKKRTGKNPTSYRKS